MKTFNGEPKIPYIKKGWKHKSKARAVLHIPPTENTKRDIKAFLRLKDLKEEYPQFKHLTKALVNLKGFSFNCEIYIPKGD